MEIFLAGLYLFPLVISALLPAAPYKLVKPLVMGAAGLLSFLAIAAYTGINGVHYIQLPAACNLGVAIADLLLLVFFAIAGFRQKSPVVALLSVLQLGGLFYLLQLADHATAPQLSIDRLSGFMFLLINIISSIIAIFSLQYMQDENCSTFRKKYFLSIIFWFIAAMNLVVSADNLEYFFLFFELTTLASYLLIRFRGDETSRKNALTALWMNQIGGIALLAAMYFIHFSGAGEASFTNLLALGATDTLLPVFALICIAALIKGAQMPFSKWLLGAMVAPTPVSALLHSSTMVKIAPFVLIKLAPAISQTVIARVIIGLTAFVFLAAAIGALAQDNLKKILAHSTISLLALMMMMAALGTPVTLIAALILMAFHGIAKSMLFLNAGILEKVFHLKETSDMDKLGETGPFTAMVMLIGFMSLLLPPFGAFIGKWLSIETLGNFAAEAKLIGAITLVAVACGGAILTLLYFKVAGLLINRTGNHDRITFERTGPVYKSTMYALLLLTALGILSLPWMLIHFFAPAATAALHQAAPVALQGFQLQVGAISLPIVPMAIAMLLLPCTLAAAMFIRFKNVDRAGEYVCGEKVQYAFGSFYFSTETAVPYFHAIGTLFFLALLAAAML